MDNRHVLQVFSDDQAFAGQVDSALSLVSGFSVTHSPTAEFLTGRAAHQPATLVIFDVDEGAHLANPKLYEMRRNLRPGTGFIVVSHDLATERLREVVRLNSSDWLRKPVDRRE